MDVIEQLRQQNAKFFWSSKLKIVDLPGKGTSVVCNEPLRANETIIHVPSRMLVNIDTVTHNSQFHRELTTHEMLALELIRRKRGNEGDQWVESLPANFNSMPMSWLQFTPESAWLPERYWNRIEEQRQEVRLFAQTCQLALEEAQWAWQAVNTRCLYWSRGGMTLAPALDYLNHTCDIKGDSALKVEPCSEGLTVTTQREYEAGEEMVFCYGPHENGFLLVEYGFMVPKNPWNFCDISEFVASKVESQREWLTSQGYWGEWTIDNEGQPSFRVEVALASIQAPNTRVLTALVGGYDDGSRYSAKTHQHLREIGHEVANKIELAKHQEALLDQLDQLAQFYDENMLIIYKLS